MVSGTLRMVRMFEVTSSPVWPSPRVMPVVSRAPPPSRWLVAQRHAQAVHLVLGHILDRQRAGQLAAAGVPGGQLLGGVGVVQREHGPRVRDLAEALGGLAADALGGRVGGEQLGVRGFELLQLVHQRVVGGVGDLRRVENVIQMLVAAQFGAEFGGALGRRCVWGGSFAHGENYRRPGAG